jgi:hypothetical protein
MIGEVAANDVAPPFPLLGNQLVHGPSQFLFDFPRGRPHPVASRVALKLERATAQAPADVRKAQDVEDLRCAEAHAGHNQWRTGSAVDVAPQARNRVARQDTKPASPAAHIPSAPDHNPTIGCLHPEIGQ